MVLNQEQSQVVRRERALLGELQTLLGRLGAPDEDLDLLRTTLAQIEELFLLVVVGEFNAGKSAFLNAMLGNRLLEEGVLPTTAAIHLLRYGPETRRRAAGDDTLLVELPVEWLQEINLVDTPGTNAVIQRHQEITEHFIPQSDLVLFVTSADRPFSESERTFLARVRAWGKKFVVVINKIDLIEQASDRQKIVDFVRENARQLLGVDPQIFTVSARLALQAKLAGSDGAPAQPAWGNSGFGALEAFILHTLDRSERVRLKLENPLGVAGRLIDRYAGELQERESLLQGDFKALETIDEQMAAHEADMRRDFKYHLSHVDNVLYAMAERGDGYFDETLRLGRVMDLFNTEKLRGEFDRTVVADTSREIDQQVSELIDWLVDQDYRQWRAVMEYLRKQSSERAGQMVGAVNTDFDLNRQALLAGLGRKAQAVVDSYDPQAESLQLAQQIQGAVVQAAAVQVGALGLGAVLVAVLHGAFLDITGVLGASAVAALGFFVLPSRRSQLKAELRTRIGGLRAQLSTSITTQFEKELGDSLQRMQEAIAPYTRFVRVEREKLDRLTADVQALRTELGEIRSRIGMLT
jgi:small GTP-binding protein